MVLFSECKGPPFTPGSSRLNSVGVDAVGSWFYRRMRIERTMIADPLLWIRSGMKAGTMANSQRHSNGFALAVPARVHRCTNARKTRQECHLVPLFGTRGGPSRRPGALVK